MYDAGNVTESNVTYENATTSASVTPGSVVNASVVTATAASVTADENATTSWLMDSEAFNHTSTSTVVEPTLLYAEVDS